MKTTIFIWLLVIFMLASCEVQNPFKPPASQGKPPQQSQQEEWLIPVDEVLDGGPGKDGIPALEMPEKWILEDEGNEYLSDYSLVLGFSDGDEYCAYPHNILDWHEIINDKVGDQWIAVTYCPLTGTGIGWDRTLLEEVSTFGVSGLLYNSNLIPYDRKTGSNWSQIRLDCVNGTLKGTRAKILPMVETTWETWKEMYPGTSVVSTNTGHHRNYERYPYGDYRTDPGLIFNVKPEDNTLNPKERVLGVISQGNMRVYRFSSFHNSLELIKDRLGSMDVIIAGKFKKFMVAFNPEVSPGVVLEFTPIQDQGPVIMEDQEGSRWDIFGRAVSGPRKGEQLDIPESFMGYWFAMAAFYPRPTIY